MSSIPKEVVELVHEAILSGVSKETFQQFLEETRKNGNKRIV